MRDDVPNPGRGPRFTISEVLDLERPAWARGKGDEVAHYDGIQLWLLKPSGRQEALTRQVPKAGWWHRAKCNCPACREARQGPPGRRGRR